MKDESSFTISPSERKTRRDQLAAGLRDKAYRDEFVRQQIEMGLPFQIRAMRKEAEWSQKEFGERLGKPQSVVSRLERPDYGRFSLSTLLEVASVCDVGLLVTFVPFGTLLDRASGFSVSDVNVPSFAKDPAFKPRSAASKVTAIRGGTVTGDLCFFAESATTPDNLDSQNASAGDVVVIGEEYAA